MHILFDDIFSDSYLDYACLPGDLRVKVYSCAPLQRVDGLYFIRARGIRILFNYFFEVGLVNLIRKIQSRLKETNRNQKYITFGMGEIIGGTSDIYQQGTKVFFIAPTHPACAERIVLPSHLLQPVTSLTPAITKQFKQKNVIAFDDNWSNYTPNDSWLTDLVKISGWSPFSGHEIDHTAVSNLFAQLTKKETLEASLARSKSIAFTPTTIQTSTSSAQQIKEGQKKAIIIGWGQYAKTNVAPNLATDISITKIKEIDPAQLGSIQNLPYAGSTSATLEVNDTYDIVCVAGFIIHTPQLP